MDQMQRLERVADSIANQQCQRCWLYPGEIHDSPDHQKNHHSHRSLVENLQSLRKHDPAAQERNRKTEINHWPYCYLCWIPLHRFTPVHPPHIKGRPPNPVHCLKNSSHPAFLVTLVALLWREPYRMLLHKAADHLGIDPGMMKDFGELKTWLKQMPSTQAEIPNPHRLILAVADVLKQS